MKLSESGDARIRGYLYILGRSLKSFLPREMALDALREIESHVRERLEQTDAAESEETAVARVLAELGPPLQVARAYSAEIAVEAALATGGMGAVSRALWRLASTTVAGFFATLGLFVGYVLGLGLVATSVLKPIFPENVGLFIVDGIPRSFGAQFPVPPNAQVWGGYWVVPLSLAAGLGVLVLTHRWARAYLLWWRSRTST